MAVLNLVNRLVEDLAEGLHDFGSDALKLYLSNVSPTCDLLQYGSPAPISAANGYVACGITITISSSEQAAGVYKLEGCDPIFKAAGGAFGPFQYVVWYNATPASGPLIGWWEYAEAISLQDTETFTVDFSAANGILQISV